MRIAHLVIGRDIGGGEQIALKLLAGARDAGHEVLLLLPGAGRLADAARDRGIPTRDLAIGRAIDVRTAVRVRSALRHERIDLLHTHALLAGNLAGRFGARLAGVPVVSHAHAMERYRGTGASSALQRRLDARSARLCAAVVAVSEEMRGVLAGQGYPADRIVVIPNGVDLERRVEARRAVRSELGLADELPVAAVVGRLSPAKGQTDFLEALAGLPHLHAVVVGVDTEATGYEEVLARLAERLGVADRVVFTGYRADVPDLLAAADLLVLPSRHEALPLVVLEAMAQERPVVATRLGSLPELVEQTGAGVLAEPGDVPSLRTAIELVLADPHRAAEMGVAGRRRVEAHGSDRMVADVLALYDRVRSHTLTAS